VWALEEDLRLLCPMGPATNAWPYVYPPEACHIFPGTQTTASFLVWAALVQPGNLPCRDTQGRVAGKGLGVLGCMSGAAWQFSEKQWGQAANPGRLAHSVQDVHCRP
jgi:hypothetical protein